MPLLECLRVGLVEVGLEQIEVKPRQPYVLEEAGFLGIALAWPVGGA